MVAMLAFGGTFAYFTSKTSTVSASKVTTGHVAVALGTKNSITKAFTADFAVPGDTVWSVDLDVDTSKTNVKTYVFATWTLTNESGVKLTVTAPAAATWKQLKNGETDVAGVFYAEVEAATTSLSFTSTVVFDTTNGNDTMDKEVSCSVSFAQAQFDHMESAYAAYQAANA